MLSCPVTAVLHVCGHWPYAFWLDKHSVSGEDWRLSLKGLPYLLEEPDNKLQSQDQLCVYVKCVTSLPLSHLAECVAHLKHNPEPHSINPIGLYFSFTISSPLEAHTQQQHFSKSLQILLASSQHKQYLNLVGQGSISTSGMMLSIVFRDIEESLVYHKSKLDFLFILMPNEALK